MKFDSMNERKILSPIIVYIQMNMIHGLDSDIKTSNNWNLHKMLLLCIFFILFFAVSVRLNGTEFIVFSVPLGLLHKWRASLIQQNDNIVLIYSNFIVFRSSNTRYMQIAWCNWMTAHIIYLIDFGQWFPIFQTKSSTIWIQSFQIRLRQLKIVGKNNMSEVRFH